MQRWTNNQIYKRTASNLTCKATKSCLLKPSCMIWTDLEFKFAFKIHQYLTTWAIYSWFNPILLINQIGQAILFIQKQSLNIKCSAGQFVRTICSVFLFVLCIGPPFAGHGLDTLGSTAINTAAYRMFWTVYDPKVFQALAFIRL